MAAYLLAVDSVADLLARPEVATAWESPSALAEWTVGGVAGHLAGQAIVTVDRLQEEPGTDPIAIDEHYRRAAWVTAEVDDEVSAGIRASGDRTAAAGADALLSQVTEARALLPELLDATAPDRQVLILWQGWSLPRDDFLVTRMMEI